MIIIVSINYLWIVVSRKTDTTLKEFIILVPCKIHSESNPKHWIGLWKENNNVLYVYGWVGTGNVINMCSTYLCTLQQLPTMNLDIESFLSHHKDIHAYFSAILTSCLKNNNLCPIELHFSCFREYRYQTFCVIKNPRVSINHMLSWYE